MAIFFAGAASDGGGLYLSTNNGDNWSWYGNGFSYPQAVNSIVVDNETNVFVAAYNEGVWKFCLAL